MTGDNGKKDEFIGKAKKAAGDALDDEKTKNEGKRQETEGKVKNAAKDIKEKGKDMFREK
ncbi:CsbD family protein [Salinicoccus carnicancri]|uniref:CsbD family protein n=1 Tax=Salinicoccus carnicancri TaxID=558170 RepID=UPI0002EFB47C|nr:CsbD family protein [Salinicoccus carnicancri]